MGKKPENRPRSYKYSFRLNEELNLRFERMLAEAGCADNRSRFIVRRIFGEPFTVVNRDPARMELVARLNDFHYQFQRIGNNYNQVVKAINAHFSAASIPRQIAALEQQRTGELKALCVEILDLAKRLAKEW
ncbi:MAG: mobilization protein [Bacteroides cellulosilyticus]|nr:mobilization protein [Bacteroides cellulosilyticus]